MPGSLLNKQNCSRLNSSLSSLLPQQDAQSKNTQAGPGSLSQAGLPFWDVPAGTEAEARKDMLRSH